jgi:hypothetical protein
VAGGIGKILTLGKQSASVAAQVFYNAVRPDLSPRWAVNLQFALLFP